MREAVRRRNRSTKAIEIQTGLSPRTAYEGFVAEATKIGELYADLAKEAYKPFEVLRGEGRAGEVKWCRQR